MRLFSRIWFPVAVTAAAAAGSLGMGSGSVEKTYCLDGCSFSEAQDTVIYPIAGYKLGRTGDFLPEALADSLLDDTYEDSTAVIDTLPHLTARDTIKAPDSLRLTDPWRYKYYVALMDSLTHVIVRDSLKHSSDSLKSSFASLLQEGDSLRAFGDSLHARMDSLDWRKVDSIYLADSSAAARERFLIWYNSLSRKERKKYDAEQMLPIKMAEMDSLRKVKEAKQALKDSITEYTPRILETFALPDSMQYKRLFAWTEDRDFHNLNTYFPDTTYNYHYYDYPFQKKDVNATWLGVAGSPVQYYNFFNRTSREGVDFYDALESWSFSPGSVPQYNTKTPHTELAYFGTLLASDAKESDNIHILTTQNITPALNFTINYDRYGGGGILENETTKNKSFHTVVNYLGKKYLAHGGFIRNTVERGENGGVVDNFWIRDTTVNSREVAVSLKNASSKTGKTTFFLDQQLRIPFNIRERIRARRDSTYSFNPDSLDKDASTAFIGHSTEFSRYYRTYNDKLSASDPTGSAFFNNVFNHNPTQSADSMGMTRFENKIFLRLQPWKSDAIVSKLDVGVGDYLKQYFDSSYVRGTKRTENSAYLYAGAEGKYRDLFSWNARGRYVFLGNDLGSFNLEGNLALSFCPFRKARKSPVNVKAHFETSLWEPTWYQQHFNSNHYRWDNNLSKISTTKIGGSIDIPYWKMRADVGYALLANNIYYDTDGCAKQNTQAMSVLSASLSKNFVFGPAHFDNRVLLQYSSNQDVVPVPLAAFNLRWYAQFVVQRDATKTYNVMEMQIGINAFYNTQWYSPGWNPVLGVFHNQKDCLYENGPYFDIFMNIQWKRACIFIKYQNFGTGWPMESVDYFTAHHYIGSQDGTDGLKIGIFWPFHAGTVKHNQVSM